METYDNLVSSMQTHIEDIEKTIKERFEYHLKKCEEGNKTETPIKEETKPKIVKINGIKCIVEDNKYYKLKGTEKGELFASKNKKGELVLAEDEEE